MTPLATTTVSDSMFWLLVVLIALISLLILIITALAVYSAHCERVKQRESEIEWTGELVATLKSLRRGISQIVKRLDGRDAYAQRELAEAKRLILDVEERLTGQIVETRDIARDTKQQITNIHGGMNNLGNNSIGGGQSQRD